MYPTIGSPATYQIRVIGSLDETWSNRLGNLTITSTHVEDQQIITSLHGDVVDQAALFGVLMALYDLRLPLLSVECLGKTKSGIMDKHKKHSTPSRDNEFIINSKKRRISNGNTNRMEI